MPTIDPEPLPPQLRQMAVSFGVDAAGYDRARPAYPDALIARITAESPGPELLDVGCGTGIAARQFQAAGCAVLGVEPDSRMAEFARERGVPVEVGTFETWEPAGRSFDAVTAAQAWHWVDPVLGARKAAAVLRPDGRLAIFGHAYEPPIEIAEPFAAAVARVVPDFPFAGQPARRSIDFYRAEYAKVADRVRDTGDFANPELWQFDWRQDYTRDRWLELLPTTGGLTRLRADQLSEILTEVGAAIDALGGTFTMDFTTLVTTATRLR